MLETNLMERERANVLLDQLGQVLSSTQRETLTLYYAEDLSLSEIAERYGVSRQAIHHRISQGLQTLEAVEAELGIVARRQALLAEVEALREELGAVDEAIEAHLKRLEAMAYADWKKDKKQ